MSIEIKSYISEGKLIVIIEKNIPQVISEELYESMPTQTNLLETTCIHMREAFDDGNYAQALRYAELAQNHIKKVLKGLKEYV